MIDEDIDIEFETRLRVTLDEMIPKLVSAAALVVAVDVHEVRTADIVVPLRSTDSPRPRRLLIAALAVAATVVGLIVMARRGADELAPADASPSANDAVPGWYEMIRPSLPARFSNVALTLATDIQLWFVALGPADGKALEIQLASGGYSTEPVTDVDATGEWVESAQGWSVKTPSGLFVSVTCDVGAGGRDFPGPPNYCDMTSTGAFTKTEIRTVVNALATSLTPAIFDKRIGTPSADTISTTSATALIAGAVPDQQQISDTDWGQGGSDHVYDFARGTARPDTCVRILHGVYPPPVVTARATWALYDDAAAFWVFGPGGLAVRISSTDPGPSSLTRLEQLAHDVVRLDPRSSVAETTVPTETALVTTPTIVGSLPVGISDATLVHPEEGTYVIVAGDFPANIAQKFKVRFGDLMGINGWTLVGNVVPEFPPVGTTIRIPPGWTAPAGSVATTTAITATTGS